MKKESLLESIPKLIMAVVLIVCVGAVLGLMGYVLTKKQIRVPEVKMPEEVIQDDTSDWKTYWNEEYGFEVKYPEDFIKQETVSDDSLLYLRRTEGGSNVFINLCLKKNYQINRIISEVKAEEIKIGDRLGYKYFYQEGVGYSGVMLVQLGQDALELTYDFIGSNKDNKISKEDFVKNNLNQILSTFKFIE